MFRFLKYLSLAFKAGYGGKAHASDDDLQYFWLKAHFNDKRDSRFIDRVIVELNVVVQAKLPDVSIKTWERLWRFKHYDRKYFLGVDLVNAPTRSIVCLLVHYGDLDDNALLNTWEWATQRDLMLSPSKIEGSRHLQYVAAMTDMIKRLNFWVNERNA